MLRNPFLAKLVIVLCLLPMLIAAAEAEKAKSSKFMRYVEDAENGGTLDAGIVTYRNADGVTVDLIGAVHVADEAYFDQLNERFTRYDSVLYEMVKPAGTGAPRQGARSDSPVSGLQRMLKTILELEFQLDAIDYSKANFVHADLDAETFQQLQSERGESLLALMLRAIMNDISRPRAGAGGAQPPTLQDLLTAASAPDRGRQLKLLLAPQFQDMEAIVAGFGDADGESVIITERNKAAMKVLEQQIAKGDRTIGIFYGAAHLPDMEERLQAMGFEPVAQTWLVAWDMRLENHEQDEKDEPIEAEEVEAPQYERI